MAEVKWIKITTNMFEDEKIDFIESLPEADVILVIWIKLLTLAGKCNANGYIYLTEKIPYTPEMLAHKFRRPLPTVQLALETLVRLEMIIIEDNGYIKIKNWEKHQNIEGMEKIREQNRIRKQRQRQREKEEKQSLQEDESQESHVTCHVTSRDSHAIDIEEELDKDKEINNSICNANETANDIEAVINFYIEHFGDHNLMHLETIESYMDEMQPALVKHAMELAVQRDKRFFRYVRGILESWLSKGIKTLEDYEREELGRNKPCVQPQEDCGGGPYVPNVEETRELMEKIWGRFKYEDAAT